MSHLAVKLISNTPVLCYHWTIANVMLGCSSTLHNKSAEATYCQHFLIYSAITHTYNLL